MRWLRHNIYLLALVALVGVFFIPLVFGTMPIAADALLGIYHPWRDVIWDGLTAVPFQNPLITDPIRQQFPYRELAISLFKQGQLPLWNPYAFSGVPLLGNIQSAAWYPLNLLLFVLPFDRAWTILIVLQQLLAGVFLYAYLRYFRIDRRAILVSVLAWSFSGFFIAWLTWNTVIHTALWLPLILLAKEHLSDRFRLAWAAILILAESAVVLAGHPQTAVYVLGFTTVYVLIRAVQKSRPHRNVYTTLWKKLAPFAVTGLVVLVITSIQTIPLLRFITLSARSFDLPNWQRPDWFVPWQHLAQLIAPDFFGNPATGNYWGVWNYGEFVSFIGVIPLLLAAVAVIIRRDKKTLFATAAAAGVLIFALPTPIAQLPYRLQLPLIVTMQPSRIMVLFQFCVSVLAGLGLDRLLYRKKRSSKQVLLAAGMLLLGLIVMWAVALFGEGVVKTADMLVAVRNLILPTGLAVLGTALVLLLNQRNKRLQTVLYIGIVTLVAFDLLRFGTKFTPFVRQDWLYPSTQTIDFLQNNIGHHRLMTADRRVFPPNVSSVYRLQSVDGYDPLYLRRHGELIAAWTRGKPDIAPAAFNRILIPQTTDSFFPDLLGVKYILSLEPLEQENLQLVFTEGETKVYENTTVLPRALLAEEVVVVDSDQEVVERLFSDADQLDKRVFTTDRVQIASAALATDEGAEIISYTENQVRVRVTATQQRLLLLTDSYYPSWRVFIDDVPSALLRVDHAFRGVVVPAGAHDVVFRAALSLKEG